MYFMQRQPLAMENMAVFDLSALSILVVDDNVYMRRLVRAMLGGFGVRSIVEASDGAEALARMAQGHFDFLIVDWEMPVVDGPELVRLVRRPDHPFAYTPIIMITGHSTYGRIQAGLGLGVNDVLCKPFSPKSLYLRLINNVLHPRPFLRTKDYFGPVLRQTITEEPAIPAPEVLHSLSEETAAVRDIATIE